MVHQLSTYLARSPARLLDRVQTITRQYAGHDLTLLFALSANLPDADLGRAVSALTNLKSTRTVGCLSGRLGSTRINNRNVDNDVLSLSVAVLDSKDVKVFRSTIPGREETQVGRWHAFRRREDSEERKDYSLNEGVSWEEVWEGGKGASLPEELRAMDPKQLRGILYFSDLKPEGLLSSFRRLPNVTKLGLLASSTPFITGRPVTLFQDQEIFSSGAVGIALTGSENVTKPGFEVEFLDVRRLGEPMTITQCEGNMVNTLDGDNPTQLLISAIKNASLDTHVSGSFKEEEHFSLGALDANGKLDRVYRITAGDPSRGSLSLDSPFAPSVGTRVQFLHRPSTAIPSISIPQPSISPTFNFLTVSDELAVQLQSRGRAVEEDFEMVLENSFLASSENGFIFERERFVGENVKCSLEGSFGKISLPSASS